MILVFGGGGQLGRELARLAKARGAALVALPRAVADIAQPTGVAAALRAHRPTLVINAAAYTNVDGAERDFAAAHQGNALGPAVLAHACAGAAIPLLHVSTDYVFDGTKAGAYAEDEPVAPVGAYGRTKAAGETAIRRAQPRHVILRTSWLYGEFGHNFLKTILRLAREREELRIVADQHGCPTSTRDLATAILRIAPRLQAHDMQALDDVWGTYHFAGAGVTTWHGFAERIVAAQSLFTGRRPPVTPIATADYPTTARRPANSQLGCTRFIARFGFAPRPWAVETIAAVTALGRAAPIPNAARVPHVA